jgi:hypothetical protein
MDKDIEFGDNVKVIKGYECGKDEVMTRASLLSAMKMMACGYDVVYLSAEKEETEKKFNKILDTLDIKRVKYEDKGLGLMEPPCFGSGKLSFMKWEK